MWYKNIPKYCVIMTLVAVVTVCVLYGLQTGVTVAQPTFYPRSQDSNTRNYEPAYPSYPPYQSNTYQSNAYQSNYQPNYQSSYQQSYTPPWVNSGETPLPSYTPNYTPNYSGYDSGFGGLNNNYGNNFGGSFGGWSDITSLLGFRMPASGLELLVVIAMYGFRYISLVQKRLKDGDDTVLVRIDANEARQNTELEKILNVLDTFRRETYDAHRELNQKMDGLLPYRSAG